MLGIVTIGAVVLTNVPAVSGALVLLLTVWGFLALLLTALAMLTICFLVALVLLIVDAARHLRAIQRTLDKH